MLRRAVPKEPAAKARPAKRTVVAKAVDMGATDASLFAGVSSDSVSQKASDAEQYYRLYEKHPWIRSCIRIIANAVAQEGYDIVKVDGEDEKPLTDEDDSRVGEIHAFLRTAFVGKCNTFRKARKSTVIDGQTYGSAYWHRKYAVVDGVQTLVGLERLDARFITPKLNKERTAIEGYTIRKGSGQPGSPEAVAAAGNTTSLAVGSIDLKAEEVIMFAGDEGGDAVLGSPSPLEALDLTAAMDLNVRHFRNAMFRNGQAVGNVFINRDGEEDQVLAAVKSLQSMKTGVANAGKNLVLTGDWDVKSMLQQGRQDVDFIKGSELTIEEVCAVFSVPPSKLRDVSGSMGQAGKGEDDDTFEQECILPIEENFYETVTNEILRKDFGIEDLALVPARRNKLRLDLFDAALKLVKFGGTGNQALDLVGLPPSDDPSMDIPLFIGATTKQGVVGDEISPDPATLDAEAQAQGVTAPADVQNNDGVAKNSAKGKERFII